MSTIAEQFPWAVEGADAVVYEQGGWGYTNVTRAKIARVSASRVTLENGQVYYAPKGSSELRVYGRDYYRSPYLIPTDDPRIADAEEVQRKRAIQTDAKTAVKVWQNYSSDVSKAEAAVKALQAFIEAHKENQ